MQVPQARISCTSHAACPAVPFCDMHDTSSTASRHGSSRTAGVQQGSSVHSSQPAAGLSGTPSSVSRVPGSSSSSLRSSHVMSQSSSRTKSRVTELRHALAAAERPGSSKKAGSSAAAGTALYPTGVQQGRRQTSDHATSCGGLEPVLERQVLRSPTQPLSRSSSTLSASSRHRAGEGVPRSFGRSQHAAGLSSAAATAAVEDEDQGEDAYLAYLETLKAAYAAQKQLSKASAASGRASRSSPASAAAAAAVAATRLGWQAAAAVRSAGNSGRSVSPLSRLNAEWGGGHYSSGLTRRRSLTVTSSSGGYIDDSYNSNNSSNTKRVSGLGRRTTSSNSGSVYNRSFNSSTNSSRQGGGGRQHTSATTTSSGRVPAAGAAGVGRSSSPTRTPGVTNGRLTGRNESWDRLLERSPGRSVSAGKSRPSLSAAHLLTRMQLAEHLAVLERLQQARQSRARSPNVIPRRIREWH